MISRNSQAVRPGQAGFTLIELIVALGVTTIVMLGILFLFDFNNKLTRVQSNVADMQQSLRIAQYDMVRMVRMAGRGGLVPAGGLTIADNVASGTRIDDVGSPKVLAGTDVITLRGVFSTPIFQVAFTNPGASVLTGTDPKPNTADGGYVELCDRTPAGAGQALDVLRKRLDDLRAQPEAVEQLILVSPLDDRFFVVVELDLDTSVPNGTNTCPTGPGGQPSGLTLGFKIQRDLGNPYPYGPLSPKLAFDAEKGLKPVAYVGLLEEYRFYIQERYAVLDDAASGLAPVLCRGSFMGPNTNDCEEISDGVIDLQASLGLDTSNDGTISEDLDDPDTDEWYGNGIGEIKAAPASPELPASPEYQTYADLVNNNLKSLRISTLVHTRRPDNTYEAEALDALEDHTYPAPPASTESNIDDYNDNPVNSVIGRKYRRRLLQTLVNLRNLTS